MTGPVDSPFPSQMMPCIEEFLQCDSLRVAGRDFYTEVFQTSLFFPLQRQRELKKMIQTAKKIQPTTIMEIGADKGGGLYHWCKCIPNVERIIACEIRGTPYRHLFEDTFPHIEFLWIEGSSYDPQAKLTVEKWLKGTKIDCLFIDGDKTEFVTDFDLYLPLMNPKGIVFTHDVTDPSPGEAFNTLEDRGYRSERIIDTTDSLQSLEKERLGHPPLGGHDAWLRNWRGRSCGVGVIYLD